MVWKIQKVEDGKNDIVDGRSVRTFFYYVVEAQVHKEGVGRNGKSNNRCDII